MSFVKRAKAYARKAKKSKKHGKWSRLACLRFLGDLKRAKSDDCSFYFSKEHAIDACEFIEKMPHIEGQWETPNITLHDSQVFFVVNIFGFRNRSDDTRRFTTALWASGRKNGKSTLAAPIGLYCQLAEGENGAQVVSAATTGGQARIVFNVAKRMVELEHDLRDYFNVVPYANSIAGFGNGSSFKPINSKASTQDGLNPSCAIVDEVHAHPNHDLINVLKSAAGARVNPLFLFVTTEGYQNGDTPWPEMRMYSHQILEGVVEADHFFTVIFSVDDEDDEYNPDAWIKANPIMEVNPILAKEIQKEATEAQSMPGKAAEFRIKRLNRPSASADSFIDLEAWKNCGGGLGLDELQGYPCVGALDVSANRDLTSFRMTWFVDGEYHTHGWRFIPKDGIHQKSSTGSNIYQSWIEQGFLIETNGKTVNQDVIIEKIIELNTRFQPISICTDPWNAHEIKRKLSEKGVEIDYFEQNFKEYHPAIKKFEEIYINGLLKHSNDPVLQWCAANLVLKYNSSMSQAPDKRNSANKIDDVVTLIMCIGLLLNFKPKQTFDDIMNNRIMTTL